jgi:hypothetical protein
MWARDHRGIPGISRNVQLFGLRTNSSPFDVPSYTCTFCADLGHQLVGTSRVWERRFPHPSACNYEQSEFCLWHREYELVSAMARILLLL